MRDNSSRRGAADLGTPLMIVAFLVMGGFLVWLYQQSEAEEALQLQEAQEAAAQQAEAERRADMLIQPENIQMDASPYAGDTVLIEGQAVASQLGTQGFWLEMPNGNPFLVSYPESQRSQELSTGQSTNVTGVITAMNDSILTAWTESGSIGEGDRLAAEFATHFLDAQEVELVQGGGEGEGGQGGEGDEGESGGEAGEGGA